ncbi:thiamine phosphate synthase [Ursidibacter maritimus]|uniref:Thiamine-phosphate synthase n=1 Tax=Ursidibacter maritimus TaxID=1331689 RepID=A0A949T4G1_9PAST|nr:thiamine phosphate synthase [Ursidibacter maritimus]KAE9539008.1 thiamine phosphate synthase [Ursidibacter maritimus]MBV6523747.1 thiamine phosphate synthase [Ursidibacter maritimus]MBV6526026.1 thiamine phosphate synthase [Ursidibacter maritimus]MBV6527941.1 thiamine phosphate synthase [Ursidibacter maritimus]MBV6528880.1 thiamine phosphate synthase [Ursidibacter maritimus]
MQNIRQILPLYFVAGSQDCNHLPGNAADNLVAVLEETLKAGITCFQFRDKGKSSLEQFPEQQTALAIKCRDLCRQYNVPFIINDNVELALAIEADGIHVGQSDMSPKAIRAKTDKPLIIGLSVNKMEEAEFSNVVDEIDYFGIGPIFPTQSKEDPKPVVGMAFIQKLRQAGITKPLVAIGGVKEDSVEQLIAYGADGVAVITAITHAKDIATTVEGFLKQVAKGTSNATK